MAAKFIHYQEVKVLETARWEEYRGWIGYIFAICPDEAEEYEPYEQIEITEDTIYVYTVYLPQIEEVISFNEDELEATGNFKKYEDFYDGSSITVSQDGELLDVHIVDKKNNESK